MNVLVDFHTHSNASDGELAPAALVDRAVAAGVSAMAITDHDTLDGYRSVADQVPSEIRLIPGVELSCVWGKCNIHIVGLGIDPDSAPIDALLKRLDKARDSRAKTIASKLERAGMPDALAGARACWGGGQIGRPHFASWMVASGYVRDVNQAFDQWLGRGKPGDISVFWPPMTEVVAVVLEAGGIPILAHPLKYGLTGMKLQALTAAFVQAGGEALEIYSGRQSKEEASRLRRLAEAHGLLASMGSDFHREWRYGPSLGVEVTVAMNLNSVWERLS